MRKAWTVILLMIGGCATPTPPVIPQRYQITIQEVRADNVYLRNDSSPGNAYSIEFFCSTNADPDMTNISPYYADMYVDIATNDWPYKRNHIDLSLDGGQTWPRRIGYGIPRDRTGYGGVFIWSPPEDYNLLTTNAMLRVTNLDGDRWTYRTPSWPYDLPSNTWCTSFGFAILGAYITEPAGGSIQWQGEGTVITWCQLGGGPVMDLYWLTPDSATSDISHWITTISNCVEGINSKVISLNVPEADAVKLVLISQSDPRLHGYSQPFTVDP